MKLLPNTIMGRTMGVVVLGFLLAGSVMVGQVYVERQTMLGNIGGWHVISRIVGVVDEVKVAPPHQRRAVLQKFQGPLFRVDLSPQSAVRFSNTNWQAQLIKDALSQQLGPIAENAFRFGGTVTLHQPNMQNLDRMHDSHDDDDHEKGPRSRSMERRKMQVLSLQLADGNWLNFTTTSAPMAPIWNSRFFWPGILSVLFVMLVSAWAVGRATKPLRIFAEAAERLGMDFNAPPLDENGPREVHRAAKAFNVMQHRLQAFVKDRTHMLAAISHDLRTPITRLKLRAEFVEDTEQRTKMLADLDEMEAMIAATLRFARDDAVQEPSSALDLSQLVREVLDGGDVECTLPDRVEFVGRPIGLKRLVGNLISNAKQFGKMVSLELIQNDQSITLIVRDDGPGIPDDMMEHVFDPFVRVENSRSRNTGGTGLGLSAVKSIAQAHGGTVTLKNISPHGLEAKVTFPC